ncbi:unnamed protein product [Aureobasidium mustum]|uniref:Uncharacterized protein n=1 Tax=Aureobasidium mustum TaxID=2773714 RepID=A0A9N8JD88_9PEZI|nr:unnamed protein product [Aureobasidium mustum]
MASNTNIAVAQVLSLFPHATDITPEGNKLATTLSTSSLTYAAESAKFEQEVQLEMDRRGNFHGNHGNDICCRRRQSVPEVAEEELERRLLWAKQMILQNPALCARSCQLPGLQEESQ